MYIYIYMCVCVCVCVRESVCVCVWFRNQKYYFFEFNLPLWNYRLQKTFM